MCMVIGEVGNNINKQEKDQNLQLVLKAMWDRGEICH